MCEVTNLMVNVLSSLSQFTKLDAVILIAGTNDVECDQTYFAQILNLNLSDHIQHKSNNMHLFSTDLTICIPNGNIFERKHQATVCHLNLNTCQIL